MSVNQKFESVRILPRNEAIGPFFRHIRVSQDYMKQRFHDFEIFASLLCTFNLNRTLFSIRSAFSPRYTNQKLSIEIDTSKSLHQ